MQQPRTLPAGDHVQCNCGKILGIDMSELILNVRHELPHCEMFIQLTEGRDCLSFISPHQALRLLPKLTDQMMLVKMDTGLGVSDEH